MTKRKKCFTLFRNDKELLNHTKQGCAKYPQRKGKMPFKTALELVPDDLPDGAYWAMAHEIAGLEYGDGFDKLD